MSGQWEWEFLACQQLFNGKSRQMEILVGFGIHPIQAARWRSQKSCYHLFMMVILYIAWNAEAI